MIVTSYYWLTDIRVWLFMVMAGDDDVLATGSEPDLEVAALRARRALERWKKQ
jgi:hypothetical protein